MPANHCIPHTEAAKEKMRKVRLGKPAPWKHRETRQQDGVTLYRCGSCGGFFPFDGFYKNTKTLLGIKSQCKTCHISTSMESRDKDNARRLCAEHMRRAMAAIVQRDLF